MNNNSATIRFGALDPPVDAESALNPRSNANNNNSVTIQFGALDLQVDAESVLRRRCAGEMSDHHQGRQ
jgi:hypothetical protein